MANTYFELPDRRLYTWTSPDGKYRNQIDFILGNKSGELIIHCCKKRPDSDCGTDHELLQATIKIKIKNTKSGKHAQKRDIENISEEYKEIVRQKLTKINPQGKDSENPWQGIRGAIKEAASNIEKVPKKKGSVWMTAETLKVIEERKLKNLETYQSSMIPPFLQLPPLIYQDLHILFFGHMEAVNPRIPC